MSAGLRYVGLTWPLFSIRQCDIWQGLLLTMDQKEMCYDAIGLCAQIANTTGRTYVIVQRENNLHYDLL
jgi:hypothetical protein